MEAEVKQKKTEDKDKVSSKSSVHFFFYFTTLTVIISYEITRSSLVLEPWKSFKFFEKKEYKNLDEGGWLTNEKDILVPTGPCNIPVIESESLTHQEFLKRFAYSTPVVIKFKKETNEVFRQMCERERLLKDWGHATVKLSSANTHSHGVKDVTLRHYVEKMIGPQDLKMLANETFYFFGYNDLDEWKEFFAKYNPPPYELPKHQAAYSFGLAGPQTGVPFHFHGPGFAETLHGRKRWLLTPYEVVPEFNPNKTTLQWFKEDYERIKSKIDLFECTISPGEVIYFPDRWWHATLNVDTAVFISTFLSP